MSNTIHPTAEVSPTAMIGDGTRIWHYVQIREDVTIGPQCILSKGVYVDFGVTIGARCKLQNGVYVYHGAILADGVFLGPGVMLLNDKNPRAITPDGALKTATDWDVSHTHIGYGAAIGGGAIILPGVSVGEWAIVGSGAVVSRDVPAYGLVYGNPARLHGFVCPCGQRLHPAETTEQTPEVILTCSACQQTIKIQRTIYNRSA